MHFKSKFPSLETTIFSQISALATKHDAINLGQGFPSFSPSSYLLERIKYHIDAGVNQYAPMSGIPKLLASIKAMHKNLYNQNLDENLEITVTSGATEAIFCAISTLVNHGDEVIIFDPSYDSYGPNIELNGGIPVHLNLYKDFTINFENLKDAICSKTKAIILNSPHNPSGKCLTKKDLDQLWDLIGDKNIYIISDEVYQHIIFDNNKHISPFSDERFRDRTFAISSFGKSFHITGWKVGYCVAPKKLSHEFRKIHQYITFSTMGAAQLAISDMIDHNFDEVLGLSKFYEEKRNFFNQSIKKTKFKALPCEGSFFQLVDYTDLSDKKDLDFCVELIQKYKLAAIPLSSFYREAPEQRIIRFCFAKDEKILAQAFNNLLPNS